MVEEILILRDAPHRSTVEIRTLTSPPAGASSVGVQDKKAYGASAAANRRLAGALQKQRSSR